MACIDLTGGKFDPRKPVTGAGGRQTATAAASTALTVPNGARWAMLTPTTQAIRVTFGGVTPTSTVGQQVAVGDTLLIGPGLLSGIRFIEVAASTSVSVEYFS